MKTLLLFRHAKSDWSAAYGSDHERPINERGRNDARLMGRFLAKINTLPDKVIVSSAVRARSTLELAMEAGEWDHPPVEITERLYEATTDDVLEVIQSQNGKFNRLLLVGHEPTWSSAIGRFIGHGRVRVSTAAMARIDFAAPSWDNITFGGKGELRWLVSPKLLR